MLSVSSVAQLCPTLQPHEPQHTRPPCPSPTPGTYSNSCPLSQWCHPTNSSSVVPFSSCPQSFPASGSFPMSQLFASGGQSIRVPASTSVLPVNTQDWSPLGWTGWTSLQSKGLSIIFSNTTIHKLALPVSKSFSLETFHRGIAKWSRAEGITSVCDFLAAVHGVQRIGCAWATDLNWRYWWFTLRRKVWVQK